MMYEHIFDEDAELKREDLEKWVLETIVSSALLEMFLAATFTYFHLSCEKRAFQTNTSYFV